MRLLSPLIPLALALAAPAQREPVPSSQKIETAEKNGPQEPRRLAAWPALSDANRDRAMGLIRQFHKKEELHRAAEDGLVAIGDSIGPLLFMQLRDGEEQVDEHIEAVLDRILDERHADLIARQIGNKRTAVRRYAALRLCRFRKPDLAKPLEAAAADPDVVAAFRGSVGLLALGRREALPKVLERVRADWNGSRPLLEEVLPGARSREAGGWLLEAAAKGKAVEQQCALRVLRYLGTEDNASGIKSYLGATDGNVKKEAVNALLVIHGRKAIENMTVFQAIGLAKEWQSR
ncbi:MAG: hypothetical protein Fur0037_03990 [Planctomycetota bacterium]